MEVIRSYETSVHILTTRRYNPQDSNKTTAARTSNPTQKRLNLKDLRWRGMKDVGDKSVLWQIGDIRGSVAQFLSSQLRSTRHPLRLFRESQGYAWRWGGGSRHKVSCDFRGLSCQLLLLHNRWKQERVTYIPWMTLLVTCQSRVQCKQRDQAFSANNCDVEQNNEENSHVA
jgi:hypothetical protein